MKAETKTVQEWLDERVETEDPDRLALINTSLVDRLLTILSQQPWDDWRDEPVTLNVEDTDQ